ncbi:MAG: PorT family protein [Salibacteraceae bacterium]|nr:PorT family protein [Salibacteraceae bacterium]
MTRSINLVFIILILSSFSLQAQSKKFEFGINGGLSFRQVTSKYPLDNNRISLGFTSGLLAEYHWLEKGSILVNPSFQRKGATSKTVFTDQFGQSTGVRKTMADFNYIVLPILLRKYNKTHHFFMNIGPYIAFLANQRLRDSEVNGLPSSSVNYTSFYNPIDFGLTAGFGAKIPIKEHFHFTAELQSSVGISNVLNNDVLAGWFDDKNYMRMFTGNIVLGVSYRL